MNIKLQTNEQLSATVANGLAGVFVNGVSLSANLSGKADLTALQNYYTKAELTGAAGVLKGYSLTSHNHDSAYKPKQTAKTSPGASGSTTSFIDTITQDVNGVITATKKNVQTASTTQAGIVQLNNTLTSTATNQAATANAVKLLNDAKAEKSDIQWIPRWSEISSEIERTGECQIAIGSLVVYNSTIYESKTSDFLTNPSLTPDGDSRWQVKPGYKEEMSPWLYVGNYTRQYRYNGTLFSSVGMTINTAGDFVLDLGSNSEYAADSINLNGQVSINGPTAVFGEQLWDEARMSYYALENQLGYALSVASGVLSSGSYVYKVADRTMTTIGINQSTTPVVVQLPAAGDKARDFILRVEISSSAAPTFTFTNTAGLDFESEDDDWAVMQPGVNLISFTETKR